MESHHVLIGALYFLLMPAYVQANDWVYREVQLTGLVPPIEEDPIRSVPTDPAFSQKACEVLYQNLDRPKLRSEKITVGHYKDLFSPPQIKTECTNVHDTGAPDPSICTEWATYKKTMECDVTFQVKLPKFIEAPIQEFIDDSYQTIETTRAELRTTLPLECAPLNIRVSANPNQSLADKITAEIQQRLRRVLEQEARRWAEETAIPTIAASIPSGGIGGAAAMSTSIANFIYRAHAAVKPILTFANEAKDFAKDLSFSTSCGWNGWNEFTEEQTASAQHPKRAIDLGLISGIIRTPVGGMSILKSLASVAPSGHPSWNIWLDRGGRTEQVVELGKSYELFLDLSRYRYDNQLSASVSSEVIQIIEENCDRDWLKFTVRPFSLDQKLQITKYEDELKVKLDRLCGNPPSKDLELIEQYRSKKLDLQGFAKAVNGDNNVNFKFVPREPGCAVMGLSIWDETGMVPLDHLVVTLPIAKPNEPPPPCGSTGDSRITLTQGAGSLLRIALDRSADNPPPVASLSMFEAEVGGDLRTVVILIERNLYENTKGRKGLHTWATEGLLRDYLANQLLDQLNEARESLDSESPNRNPYPYARMAQELEDKLFSQYQGLENAATYARNALVRAVNTAKEEFPTVLIRAVNEKNHRFIVPLGLLAAKIETPAFTKSMTVITPLPVERYPATRACINTWTLAVPESLEHDDSSQERLVEANNIVEFERIKTEAQLEKYVSSKVELRDGIDSSVPTKAEGLILLAHHAPSVIWFQDELKRVSSEKLKRRFPAGSVALLAGCSTASPEGNYQRWITKLNEHGIDAMIVSPFPVLTEYATHFALNFGLAAQSARRNNKTPTILELFQAASNATLKKFKAQYGEDTAFNEMALEFVVAGDSSLRMCANR